MIADQHVLFSRRIGQVFFIAGPIIVLISLQIEFNLKKQIKVSFVVIVIPERRSVSSVRSAASIEQEGVRASLRHGNFESFVRILAATICDRESVQFTSR